MAGNLTVLKNRNFKVVLVSPPIIRPMVYSNDRRFDPTCPSLGILSLASILRERGIKVSVLDPNVYLQFHIGSINSDLYKKLAYKILSFNPRIVGLSTIASTYIDSLEIAQNIKLISPDIFLILGGPQASFTSIETLTFFPFIDIIVRGEGEIVFTELAEKISAGHDYKDIQGISYRTNNIVIENKEKPLVPDLNSLPMPAFDLITSKEYGIDYKTPLEVGRGCPFRCTFCSTSTYWRHQVRMKNNKRVIKEINFVRSLDLNGPIGFLHDLFWINDDYIESLCNELLSKSLEISWEAYARIDNVNPKLLNSCRSSGCRKLFFGVESGSNRIKKKIGKTASHEQTTRIIESTLSSGIEAVVSFIIGFPGETADDIEKSLKLYKRLEDIGATTRLNVYLPIPGSEIYSTIKHFIFDDFFPSLIYGFEGLHANIQRKIFDFPRIFSAYYSCILGDKIREEILLINTIHDLLHNESMKKTMIESEIIQKKIASSVSTGDFRDIFRNRRSLMAMLDNKNGRQLRISLLDRLHKEGQKPSLFFLNWLRGAQLLGNLQEFSDQKTSPVMLKESLFK